MELALLFLKAQLIAMARQNAGLLQCALAADESADQLESGNAPLVRQLRKFRPPASMK
ncbi:hypothetical protein [Sphingobium baderi]|uniref:hypothetical protein n=1 Tax=Sphingobium baderi TaxID=1332080 RepID=UPI002B40B924|nr:hypothetical protein [Sphingobium baderi]WRD78711.1 hypothetical protein QQ987_20190 [Sphingobium baderi]